MKEEKTPVIRQGQKQEDWTEQNRMTDGNPHTHRRAGRRQLKRTNGDSLTQRDGLIWCDLDCRRSKNEGKSQYNAREIEGEGENEQARMKSTDVLWRWGLLIDNWLSKIGDGDDDDDDDKNDTDDDDDDINWNELRRWGLIKREHPHIHTN